MSTTQFSVGEKVVYPNHGVGIIEQISSRTIGTSVERFYLLRIRSSSLKVMVPFQNAEAVGLCCVVKNSEAQKTPRLSVGRQVREQFGLEKPV